MKVPACANTSSRYLLISMLILGLCVIDGYSQDFGRFRPGIKWNQINTPEIRVIFPAGLEFQANRVANDILYLNQNNKTSIGSYSRKLDLILNNRGIISNGYVTLMPFRSEFYTTPSQDGFSLGTNPWLDLLSVHEYRHALQYSNMRQGYTKLAWWFFGDPGWGVMMNLTTPRWFFEGDAVAMETALTAQGRGRMPSFFQQYKSILLDNRKYTYMKARNGSFRDIVPDEYELGYLLCSYGREKFGNDLWLKVVNGTSWLNGIIYPFSNSVQSNTGMSTKQLYNRALDEYREIWAGENQKNRLTPFTPLSQSTRTVTEYRFPVFQNNGDLLVYKRSYKEIGAIYRVAPDGYEEKICTTGISSDPCFSASDNQITWTEVTWDTRYSAENYSDVVVFSTDTGKKVYLTRKQRYFSPAISPDGRTIVVVEVDQKGHSRLKILDSRTGMPISTLPNPDTLFYTYPKWDTDGRSIISSVRTKNGRMMIISQLISEGTIKNLSGEYNQAIGEACVTPENILFTAGFTGTNNLYALSRKNGTVSQLTSSKFGAYYPSVSPDGRRLGYSDFNRLGYRLVTSSMDSLLWRPTDTGRPDLMHQFDFGYFKTEGGNILDKIPDTKLAITPYSPAQRLIRVHSWSLSPGFYSAGINLVSDNVLENLHLEGGFNYYYIEAAPGLTATVQYGGLFPILSAGISRYYRHANIAEVLLGEESVQPQSIEDQLSFDIQIPLNLTKGSNFRQADIRFGYHYISSKELTGGNSSAGETSIVSAISGKASFSSVQKKALQNITTPLGFSLELTGNQSVAFMRARQYQAIGDFAIQGLAWNHNLVLSGGIKFEPSVDAYHFMDLFIYPRGYSIPQYDWISTFQSSYHFPLVYPDIGFAGLFYCSRIRGLLFADAAYAFAPEYSHIDPKGILASAGAELIFDTRWFNIVDIPLGVRFSLLLKPDRNEPERKNVIEFVIPVIRL